MRYLARISATEQLRYRRIDEGMCNDVVSAFFIGFFAGLRSVTAPAVLLICCRVPRPKPGQPYFRWPDSCPLSLLFTVEQTRLHSEADLE